MSLIILMIVVTKITRNHPFEGIINNMQRRYRETESNMVREDLGKYLNMQPCPSCEGSRLRTEARHVFIDELNLPQITSKAWVLVLNTLPSSSFLANKGR